MFRVFVGTLESGEAEFKECVDRISSQVGVEIHHEIISGLSERMAHKRLVNSWLEVRANFDFFLKVDADTLLISNSTVFNLAKIMDDENASGLQVRLLDYFSGELISGLNMFSKTVEFKRRPSRLRPDLLDIRHSRVIKGDQVRSLEPIGLHGKYPNLKQAFFYGYHRYLKGQKLLLLKCFKQWDLYRDDSRLWALFGAYEASKRITRTLFFSSSEVHRHYERNKGHFISEEVIREFARKGLVSL